MRHRLRRIAVAFGVLFALAVAGATVPGEIVPTACGILSIFVGLPLLVVTSMDLLVESKTDPRRTTARRALMIVLSVPAGLFGLTSIVFGLAIVAWVLYNLLIERQPQFHGWSWWQGFGIGPALVGFGWMTVVRALSARLEPRVAAETAPVDHDFGNGDFAAAALDDTSVDSENRRA